MKKKRYVALAIECDEKFDETTVKHLVYEAVLGLLGEQGASKTGVSLKYFDAAKQLAVVRCSTPALEQVIAALAAKRYWRKQDIAIRLRGISGTLKGLESKLGAKLGEAEK
jgi:RNase P/RNase MRP subunit POP5